MADNTRSAQEQNDLAELIMSVFKTYGLLTVEELYHLLKAQRHKILLALAQLCSSGRLNAISTKTHLFFSIKVKQLEEHNEADSAVGIES